MPQAIKIQSKFKSACNTCKGKVDQGEWVFWTPGVKGVLHTECPDPSVKVKPIKVEPQFKLRDDGPIQGFESLFKHQREVVYAALDGHTRLYLGFEMGLGKSLGSLAAAEVTEQFPLIIVCPAIAKINWQREVKKWTGREAQVLKGRTPYEITEEIVIINYDILDAWTDTLIDFDAKGIIFDEAQYIKNPDSIRSKAAKAVGRTIPGMRFMLSGTPTPNSVYDLVMPLDILGVMGHFVNKTTFIKRYCPAIQTKYGISHSTSRNLSELHHNLKNSCFIRRTKDECLDLPPKIRVDIPIETAVVDDEEFYAPLLAQMRKGTMAEALRVISDNLKPADINAHIATARAEAGREKINAIVELANSIEEPLVIMVHHKEVQNAVKKGIKGKKVAMLVGGMTETKRQEAIDSFQNGESDVILCSITAAGTGINLQRGTQMIMGELPLTYALQDQAESRCHRNGAKNALTVHRLIALGTFDEQMLKILNKKESVSAAVEDGVNIKTTGPADIIAHKLLELYSLSV